jgi:GntR family transcriptional regulator
MGRPPTARSEFQFRLDAATGVPVYRQLIDQLLTAIASGKLSAGDQLPTVRQVAVDLAINPNTVMRAYRELEIRGILSTQQGTGTFITEQKVKASDAQRRRRLAQMVGEVIARAGGEGFTIDELLEVLQELQEEHKRR